MDDQEAKDNNVTLNEKTLTKEEFERRKSELEQKPGVAVVETGEKTFRSRIKG